MRISRTKQTKKQKKKSYTHSTFGEMHPEVRLRWPHNPVIRPAGHSVVIQAIYKSFSFYNVVWCLERCCAARNNSTKRGGEIQSRKVVAGGESLSGRVVAPKQGGGNWRLARQSSWTKS